MPYTLHPTPYTLHPAPCTLHPAPCTLHPKLPEPSLAHEREAEKDTHSHTHREREREREGEDLGELGCLFGVVGVVSGVLEQSRVDARTLDVAPMAPTAPLGMAPTAPLDAGACAPAVLAPSGTASRTSGTGPPPEPTKGQLEPLPSGQLEPLAGWIAVRVCAAWGGNNLRRGGDFRRAC